VLINNIAWLLRHLPVFGIGGDGNYRIRGIHVDDLAKLCLEEAVGADDRVVDAVGPERPTFNELVATIRDAVGARSLVAHVPGAIVPALSSVLGLALHDVLLTRDEYRAMASGLADTDGPSTGSTRLSTWISERGDDLGAHYANELRRHFA
jgi:NADH dehydrogenase